MASRYETAICYWIGRSKAVWFVRRFVFDGINTFWCFLQLLCISDGDCQFRPSIRFRKKTCWQKLLKQSKTESTVRRAQAAIKVRFTKALLKILHNRIRFDTRQHFLHNLMNISWCKALKSIFKPLQRECEWKPDLDWVRRCFVNRFGNKFVCRDAIRRRIFMA